MTQATPQALAMTLVSMQMSEINLDSMGNAYTVLVGIDRAGQVWTTMGVVRPQGLTLNQWEQQQRPMLLPQLPEEQPTLPLPQIEENALPTGGL